jgi:hypothetical protein
MSKILNKLYIRCSVISLSTLCFGMPT